MKKKRIEIGKDIAARVMFESNRTCCVCRDGTRKTEIHHIDCDPSNNDFSNLALICKDCQSDAHTNQAFARNLTPDLIRRYNDSWREVVKAKLTIGVEPGKLLEYQQQVLLDISIPPHRWKGHYMELYPGHFLNTSNPDIDVWQKLSLQAKHKYTNEEWTKYITLFDNAINKAISGFDRLLMCHGSVIPNEVKLLIIRTCSQLECERSVYLQLPAIINFYEDKDNAFDIRFKEVIRVLSHIDYTVEQKRKSLIASME